MSANFLFDFLNESTSMFRKKKLDTGARLQFRETMCSDFSNEDKCSLLLQLN